MAFLSSKGTGTVPNVAQSAVILPPMRTVKCCAASVQSSIIPTTTGIRIWTRSNTLKRTSPSWTHGISSSRPAPRSAYVTSSLNRQTPGVFWKEVKRDFTAIRMDEFEMHGCWNDIDKDITAIQMDQLQMQVPQYLGLRRTLQFHLRMETR